MSHYYSKTPDCAEKIDYYIAHICDKEYTFYTNTGVFSKKGLDFGTRLLLESICEDNDQMQGDLLDMGCGYGPISVVLADRYPLLSITMADVNERAIKMAQKNASVNGINNIRNFISSDCFDSVDDSYQYVVTNPPIRAGKSTVFSIYEGAYEHLKNGGILYVVIQKKQGAPSTIHKLIELFGNCDVIDKKAGYFILKSIK